MSLFQNSVLNKYLKETNQTEMKSAYEKLITYFHNPVIQQNIRESKEEEYQDGFLNALFVNVLGYTIKPNPDYNLTREFKNEKGAKKADGAILKDGAAIGVIELKSTTTKDLESIRLQAFDYKANQSKCVYVITSNFEKIRFYINNAVDFEEFELFKLKYEQFQLLWLCLAKENLLKGIPLAIKEDSVIKEANVTKKIYLDYTAFKHDLYNDLIENNLNLEILNRKDEKEIKLLLFKKSQKLIDRFLFIFFGEDRGLLPPNSISEIIKQWENQSDWGDDIHLYDRYKKYFHLLNTGWKGKKYEIFAYNGGLFAPDEVLDNVKIGNEVLKKHTEVLTGYDFETEVDVNILGHIFENSLNEIEEIAAHIEGVEVDLKKSKRKKDGVFYTPKYITKYIVENTVGKLCNEKKTELGILDFDYDKDFKLRTWRTIESVVEAKVKNEVRKVVEKRKTNISVEGTNQLEILNNYRNWLLNLTICDPACGSGAFLNQALDFLIGEHNTITEFTQKITGDVSSIFIDIENQILEKNIYGVDINEESVEIAKLSLWLRTAQKGRKLTTLSNNIKCGNSLIDDPEVAGEKAFNWQNEFPEVFRNGGFDVVIGNPPYGAKLESKIQNYLNSFYINGGSETAVSFLMLSHRNLLKKGGNFGFIIPKSFTYSSNYEPIRKYLLPDINKIIDCKKVWKEVKLEQVILLFTKDNYFESYCSSKLYGQSVIDVGEINKVNFNLYGFFLNDISKVELSIADKMRISNFFIKDIATNNRGGMIQNSLSETGDIKAIGGAEIQREGIIGIKGFVNVATVQNDAKSIIKSNSILVQNIVAHIENPVDHIKITACLPTDKDFAILDTINQITFNKDNDSKVFWILFNSKLINWYCYRFIFAKAIRTMHFDNAVTNRIPIPQKFEQQDFINKADILIKLNEDKKSLETRFYNHIQLKYKLQVTSKKLQNWPELEFKTFLAELQKAKIKLSLSEEAEWMQYFNEQKQKAQNLKSEIVKTDREIDRMVYELYGLTEEEIRIVEESTK